MSDLIGWLATAIFTGSYLCKEPVLLRRVQAGAALLWLTYGVLIHSAPVVVANAILTAVAFVSSVTSRNPKPPDPALDQLP